MLDSIIPPEQCTGCGEVFPLTTEFFHKNHRIKSGFERRCKKCRCESSRRWASQNPERVKENCRLWYAKNAERDRANTRRWASQNPEKVKEKHRNWRIANPEKARENLLRWSKENPEKIRAYSARRRARKLDAPGSHSAEDIHLQYKSQRGKCWHCGKKVGDTYHVDHLIPLYKGGSNDARNIVISCPTCNSSKGAKMPHEWNGRLF